MTPEDLYSMMKPVQENKGYYFNPDHAWVLNVLRGVLINRERYGYSSCPCRLATGDKKKDREIICPCVFREQDIAKYNSCYCRLYLSREAAEGRREIPEVIPERWLRN